MCAVSFDGYPKKMFPNIKRTDIAATVRIRPFAFGVNQPFTEPLVTPST